MDSGKELDAEMLKNLDMLLNLDVLESEGEWELLRQMDVVESSAKDDDELENE